MTTDLKQIRQKIDQLDTEIVKLLESRAEAVIEAMNVKNESGAPAYTPQREAEILKRLDKAKQKLGHAALRGIYAEILSACRALQGRQKVALLGEKFGWVHDAALKQLGSAVDVQAFEHPRDVIKSLNQGHANLGFFPLSGDLPDIRFLLEELLAQNYHIVAETRVRRTFSLISRGATDIMKVSQILVTKEFFPLVRDWAQSISFPVKIVICRTVDEIVESLVDVSPIAGLIPAAVAKTIDANMLQEEIKASEEWPYRCLTLRREPEQHIGKGQRAAVLFALQNNVGSMGELLDVLRAEKLQLYSIQTYFFGSKPWKDLFFMDFEAAVTADEQTRILKKLESKTLFLKNLGVYSVTE
ncbi:MAG TPA: chorismate mutase [Candidatus Ozemobacteraceae bacterium]|nr:chorismate mutase [Candidatus Ozemobacteraceae bacterium]